MLFSFTGVQKRQENGSRV